MVGRLHELAGTVDLWEGDHDALAFFCSPDYGRVVEIRRPTEQFVGVADSFHVKPLIRAMQQSQRFQVLCVGLRTVRLFEGDPFRLSEVKLVPQVPRSMDDPVVQQSTGQSTTLPTEHAQPSIAPGAVHADRFFRLVDQAVWEHYSRREQVPVVLCADVQYLSKFLSWSRNDYLIKGQGIALNPDAATPDRLRQEAWQIIGPAFQKEIDALKDAFQAAKARHLGSDQLPQVAEAAAVGRVGTLLVDSDVHIPGILHRHSGLLEEARMDHPRADDVLDDLAEMVLRMDGQVFVVPHGQMPTDQGVAAVYRY